MKTELLKISLSKNENDLKNQYPSFRLDKYSSGRNLNPENVFIQFFALSESSSLIRKKRIYFSNQGLKYFYE